MKTDIAMQLQITRHEAFIMAVKEAVHQYKLDKTTRRETISPKDQKAMASIIMHFDKGITNGVILRNDLKLILRGVYGKVGRFFNSFARRMEAIRNHSQFTREALERGDNLRPIDVAQLLKELAEQRQEKIKLEQELSHERKEKMSLRKELQATNNDYMNSLADNEQLTQKVEELKKEVNSLQDYILSNGLPLPGCGSKQFDSRQNTSDSKLYRGLKRGLTLFPPETLAEPPSPLSAEAKLSRKSISYSEPLTPTSFY